MNYKKKYKEAIERAKRRFSEEDLKYLFPELMENEDERIRKALIAVLRSDFETDTTIYDISVGEIITWLKSLRPQKPWKPSMDQLRCLLKYSEQNNYDGTILTSLYKDLKKYAMDC